MNDSVLIFGGTTEGRLLAKRLQEYGISHTVSVATEYGEKIELLDGEADVLVGRKSHVQMADLLHKQDYCAVVDATHPFATAVSKEIREACAQTRTPYLRLSRNTQDASGRSNCICVDSVKEAAKALNEIAGNILILTGSRDLAELSDEIADRSRLFVRVLPNAESIAKCEVAGFDGKHIIAMQGPFSAQMNESLIKEVNAQAILTKESGREGGFFDKIEAAAACKIATVVIRNPEAGVVADENGSRDSALCMNEVFEQILSLTNTTIDPKETCVTLAGTGPGDARFHTLELEEAIKDADILFGAESVVSRLHFTNGPVVPYYTGDQIAAYLKEHPVYRHALVAFSGDISVSSGAAKAADVLSDEGFAIEKISGISSVTIFAQKCNLRLEECRVISAHGRDCDVAGFVQKNEHLIVLVSNAEGANEILQTLSENVSVTAGCELGTDQELIVSLAPGSATDALHGRILLYLHNGRAFSQEQENRSFNPAERVDSREDKSAKDDKVARVLLCAPQSGSGKTTITCALLRLLERHGMKPAAFKCGPDFIDPMFHQKVLGVPSRNLDLFMAGQDGVMHALQKGMAGRDIGIIEGVMGFYDGLGTDTFDASSYELCVQTGTPAILIVNARGMGRSTVALIRGFLDYAQRGADGGVSNPASHIRGILLNQVSPSFASELSKQIEKECNIPVVGCLPKLDKEVFGSRHLGLILPDEIPDVLKQIDAVADALEAHLDLDLLVRIAKEAGNGSMSEAAYATTLSEENASEFVSKSPAAKRTGPCRVGIAYDEAFCFYYADNLDFLKESGAELVTFSPLHDKELPDVSHVIFGGGYPELYAKALSENTSMTESIRAAAKAGMPMLAECGGYLYLKESLTDPDHNTYPMVHVFDGGSKMGEKLSHFGYVSLFAAKDNPYLKPEDCIRGHEFHYYQTEGDADICTVSKPSGRKWTGYECSKNVFGGFAHLYYASCPQFVERFLAGRAD